MTSQIISDNVAESIDEDFPVAGQDNDSQGFRDNFTAIKNGLTIAGEEIGYLQTNTAKTNEDNNFNGYLIDNVQTNRMYGKEFDNGSVSGAANIDYETGEYQTFTLSNNTTFTFQNWPDTEDAYAKLRLSIKPTGTTNYTASFLTTNGVVVSQNQSNIAEFNTGSDPNVSLILEAWTQKNSVGGKDVYIDVVGNVNYYSGTTTAVSGTTISNSKSVILFKTTAPSTCSLANGIEGQIKTLVMDTYGGNMVVTVATPGWSGSGVLTFNSLGDTCTLQYINSKWFILSNNGVAVA